QPSLVFSFGPTPLLSVDWWRGATLALIGWRRLARTTFGCPGVLNLSSDKRPLQPRVGSLWRRHRRYPRAETSPCPRILLSSVCFSSPPSPSSPRRLALDPVQASVKAFGYSPSTPYLNFILLKSLHFKLP
ncbi:hypothetical protein MC885_021017, partial [Smutsia gigantea]